MSIRHTQKNQHGFQIRTTEKTYLNPGGTEIQPWPETKPGTDLSRARFPKAAIADITACTE